MSVRKILEIRLSGCNECPMAVVMDESSKPSSSDDGEERDEQVGGYLVSNKEAIKIPVKNDGRDKRFSKDG